jgi:hypothetical protein
MLYIGKYTHPDEYRCKELIRGIERSVERMTFLLLFPALSLLLLGCATAAERTARQTETATAVNAALADRHYRISITTAYPTTGGSVNVSRDFTLEVKGDTLLSYLPFFGRVYNMPYAGSEKGLNFTERIRRYEVSRPKAGLTRIKLMVRNEEDTYNYQLDVFDNGRATVGVRSTNRDYISFDGDME